MFIGNKLLNINKNKFIIFMLVISLPLTNLYFTPVRHYYSISIIASCMFFLFTLNLRIRFFKVDALYTFFIILCLLSSIFTPASNAKRLIVDVAALIFCYVVFFIGPRLKLHLVPALTINRFIFLSVVIPTSFAIVEVILENFFGLNIYDGFWGYYYHNTGTYLEYYRAQSTFYEPNHYAMFVAIFFPLSYPYFMTLSSGKKFMWGSIIFIGAVSSASSALLLSVVLSSLILFVFYRKYVALLLVISFLLFVSFYTPILSTAINKLNIFSNELVYMGRAYRWSIAFQQIYESPLFGIGGGQELRVLGFTMVSFLLRVLVEYGIPAFLVLIWFLLVIISPCAKRIFILKNTRFKNPTAIYYFISWFNCMIFLMQSPTYFYPFVFFALSFIHLYGVNFYKMSPRAN